jgi:hypothetical protein
MRFSCIGIECLRAAEVQNVALWGNGGALMKLSCYLRACTEKLQNRKP